MREHNEFLGSRCGVEVLFVGHEILHNNKEKIVRKEDPCAKIAAQLGKAMADEQEESTKRYLKEGNMTKAIVKGNFIKDLAGWINIHQVQYFRATGQKSEGFAATAIFPDATYFELAHFDTYEEAESYLDEMIEEIARQRHGDGLPRTVERSGSFWADRPPGRE